ncbi:hypothetical protein [Candidatus Sororendozoicomonas aggregata]|uniref:hypothetical protein n=1 Tax=Candidatus Sororendozoicomonas aggregata TaxID=3073239 RepID=UPI002ED2842B
MRVTCVTGEPWENKSILFSAVCSIKCNGQVVMLIGAKGNERQSSRSSENNGGVLVTARPGYDLEHPSPITNFTVN